MECKTITLPDGITAIVCRSRRARPKCAACRSAPSTLECDFPVGEGKTCDKPLCARCAVKIGRNVDHCPDHPKTQLTLEGV